jgi:LysR family transcriptional regulator, transcriptional activator of the cysJI operon
MPMNLHQLRVFCAVAEASSFSLAAEKLHLTQPAVTLQIKNLEEFYEMKFFERIGKKVLLTDEGRVLSDLATQILTLSRQTEEALADLKGLSRGTVRIATSYSFADYYLPPLLKAFHEKYPKISIKISAGNTSEIIEDTLRYRNDIGFVAYHPGNSKLVVREVVSDILLAIVPNQHKLSGRESITLNELNGEPLILRELGSSKRRMVDEVFRKKRISPLILMESASTSAIKKMVESGAGIGILSSQVVKRDVEARAFKALPFTEVEMAERFYLIYHKEKYFSGALKAFVNMVMDVSQKSWPDS